MNENEIQNYVNRELTALGLQNDILGVYSLLKQRSRQVQMKTELVKRAEILTRDYNEIESKYKRSLKVLDQKESEIKSMVSLENENKRKIQTFTKLRSELEKELKTLKIQTKSSKNQYQNESRKYHKHIQKLKDVITSAMGNTAGSINTTGGKGPSAGKLPKMPEESAREENMYAIVIENYEEREREILLENQGLRQLLLDVFNSFNSIVQLQVNDGVFQLPLEVMRDNLLDIFDNQKLMIETELQGRVAQKEDQEEAKLEMEKLLFDHQVQLEKLSLEKQELERQKELLAVEKKSFTDAAVRLGLERAQFQKEKTQWEDNIVVVEKRENELPSTPQWLQSKPKEPKSILKTKSPFKPMSFRSTTNELANKKIETPLAPKKDVQEVKSKEIPNHAKERVEDKENEDLNWLQSSNPDMSMLQDESFQSPFAKYYKLISMESEILVESKTINSAITPTTKKSVRIDESDKTPTTRFGRVGFRSMVASSTPK